MEVSPTWGMLQFSAIIVGEIDEKSEINGFYIAFTAGFRGKHFPLLGDGSRLVELCHVILRERSSHPISSHLLANYPRILSSLVHSSYKWINPTYPTEITRDITN